MNCAWWRPETPLNQHFVWRHCFWATFVTFPGWQGYIMSSYESVERFFIHVKKYSKATGLFSGIQDYPSDCPDSSKLRTTIYTYVLMLQQRERGYWSLFCIILHRLHWSLTYLSSQCCATHLHLYLTCSIGINISWSACIDK